jgi:hypothetical protein
LFSSRCVTRPEKIDGSYVGEDAAARIAPL